MEKETEKRTMKTQTKKLLTAAAALLVLIGVFAGVWMLARPAAQTGAKTITVEVVHSDESKKSFNYHTDEEYLANVLLSEGLVEGDDGDWGLFITVVDGEEAGYDANQSYWAVYQNGEYAQVGVSELPVNDGDSFSLVYTVG